MLDVDHSVLQYFFSFRDQSVNLDFLVVVYCNVQWFHNCFGVQRALAWFLLTASSFTTTQDIEPVITSSNLALAISCSGLNLQPITSCVVPYIACIRSNTQLSSSSFDNLMYFMTAG
jgi:hypothetical protein